MAATRCSSFCGAQSSAFRAAAGVQTTRVCRSGATAAVMRQKEIHPEWFPEAKVFCNGVEVMTVGGTRSEYNVDVYSGNHPFYQGKNTILVADAGQLDKFKKRFGGLGDLAEVGAAAGASGPATADEGAKKIGGGPKGGKKKRR